MPVVHAIAAGGDTDTLAAIVGGIVAARVGVGTVIDKQPLTRIL